VNILFVQNIEGIAGSEKYFWQLLPALKKEGVSVSFLCVYKKKHKQIAQTFCDYLIQKDIPVYRIETKSYLSLGLLAKIKKLLRQHLFDIIHSHLIYADFWSAALRTFFGVKTRTVSTLHGYQENIYTQFCLKPDQVPKNNYYRVARFAYKRIDHVYSCSEGLKDFFLGAGIQFKNAVKVIHHGFDYVKIEPVAKNNSSEFQCAIPGRLIPRKGHQLVLKHCAELREKITGFKLVIIGDGELRAQLEKYVLDNDLKDCVIFTGNVGDVRPHLASADLVLIPSYAEGLPLVIFEAMSVSKPVIAYDTIGPAEAVEKGLTGYLIKPFDDTQFAEKVIALAQNPKELEILGANGKISVETKFSLAVMTKNTINFYQMCLN
jgi:glycosyltransferase involved in cell wall biosynthesis